MGGDGAAVEAQGIIGVVNAEGRIDDGKHRLQLESGGHARNPVSAGNGLRYWRELPEVLPPPDSKRKAGVSVGQPNRVLSRVLYWTGLICNCDVRRIGIDAHVDKGRDRDRASDGDAVFEVAVQD